MENLKKNLSEYQIANLNPDQINRLKGFSPSQWEDMRERTSLLNRARNAQNQANQTNSNPNQENNHETQQEH